MDTAGYGWLKWMPPEGTFLDFYCVHSFFLHLRFCLFSVFVSYVLYSILYGIVLLPEIICIVIFLVYGVDPLTYTTFNLLWCCTTFSSPCA